MALIPPFFLDCIVAIGVLDGGGLKTNWLGSGFLVGRYIRRLNETTNVYRVYLVTNRHVIERYDELELRFKPELGEPAQQFKIKVGKSEFPQRWMVHTDPSIDTAVVPILFEHLREQRIRADYFRDDRHVLTKAAAQSAGVSDDQVFVLGFPMGLVGERRSYPIVRQGCLARVRDTLAGDAVDFLVDAAVFPGNSGGPVVTRPDLSGIDGTRTPDAANLIGIVQSYIPYRDIAYTGQTQRPMMIFTENSGLASVLPYDYIAEAIDAHLMALGGPSPEAPVLQSDAPASEIGKPSLEDNGDTA